MIGDVNLDDFFPEEQLDSTMVGKSQTKFHIRYLTSQKNMPINGTKKIKSL